MKKLLKIVLGILLLLIATPVVLALFVDLNDFKGEIQERVAKATGRELNLAGELRLSLFPWAGIELREASLSQPPGFGAGPFARVEEAQVQVRLLPLLRGRLELEEIRGRGVELSLIRLRDGRANWQAWGRSERQAGAKAPPPRGARVTAGSVGPPDLLPTRPGARLPLLKVSAVSAPAEAPAANGLGPPRGSGATQVPADTPPAASALRLGGVSLEDVRLDWQDRQSGLHLAFDGLSLSTGPVVPGAAVDFRLAGPVRGAGMPLAGDLVLTARAAPAEDGAQITLDPFELRLEGPARVGGLDAAGSLAGRLDAELAARRYRLRGLTLGLQASGGPIGAEPIRLRGEGEALLDARAGTLDLKGWRLTSGELRLHGDAAGRGLRGDPRFDGSLVLDQMDLRAWLERHGLPTPRTRSRGAFTRVNLQGEWRAQGGRVDLQDLVMTLDRSQITGTLSLLAGAPLGYRFDLKADRLDLDAYLPAAPGRRPGDPGPGGPPPSDDAGSPPASSLMTSPAQHSVAASEPSASAWAFVRTSQGRSAQAGFPREILRGLDLAGRARVDALQLRGLALGEVDADITAAGGHLRLNQRVGSFYGGRLQGHAGLRADLDPPRIVLVQYGEGVQAGALLKDLIGEDLITGEGRFETDLSAEGHTPHAIRRSLSGEAAVHLAGGSIKGFDLEQFIRRAQARLEGRPVPPRGPERTRFDDLRATAQIDDGVLTNRDLLITSDYVSASGSGSIDIVEERLDYRFEPRFVDQPEGLDIEEIEGIPIPVLITGSLRRPAWSIDLAAVLRDVSERKLGTGLDLGEKIRELEEQLDVEGLEKGLRQLLDF
jgi:AsmA protein